MGEVLSSYGALNPALMKSSMEHVEAKMGGKLGDSRNRNQIGVELKTKQEI